MALTDLTRISTSGIATGTSLSGAVLHGDAHFRGTQVGVTSALFDSSDNALEFNEDAKLKFGNTLSIYKATGSHAIIDNTFATGSYLRIGSANGIILGSPLSHNQTMMRGYVNGRSELYHAGNLKLTTDQAGVKVTGILTATSFSGPLNSSPINNPSGISTFYDLRVSNNLTVEGTTTTLDTNLIGVDRVEVGANSNSVVGVAITQSGTADILRLYDGASQVVTVAGDGTVGIGSATPLSAMALDVIGSIRYSAAMRGASGSASTPSYAFYADHDSGMYRGGTNVLSFATAGNERLTIDADGRHLIGSPTNRFYAAKLQVQGTSDSNYIMMHNTTAGDGNGARYSKFIYSGTQSGGETSDLAHINAAHDGSADDQKGRLEFRVNTGAQNHSPVEALRIDSSGNVSIHSGAYSGGGAAPQLYVRGTGGRQVKIHNSNVGTSMLQITNATTGEGEDAGTQLFTQATTGDFHIRNHFATGDLVFATKASGASTTDKLRIASDGKLMTQAAGYIYTASSAGSLTLYGGNTNKGGGIILSGGNSPSTGDVRFYAQMSQSSPAERLRITSGGSVNIATTSSRLSQTTFKSQIETGTNKLISFGAAEGSAFSDQGAAVIFSRPSNGAEKICAIFQHTNQSLGIAARDDFTVSTGGNAFYYSTTERLRITSGGIIQIGGANANSTDIDSTNTKLTIKQTANNQEDGIYIERSGERRGHYIYVGGALGQSDALCVTTNQLGSDTHILALDRSGNIVTGTGKVGINESSNINGRLHVQHDALAENILYATRYNDQAADKPILAVTEALMTGMTASGLIIGNHNRPIHIGAVFDSSAAVTTGSVTGMTLLSNGRIGISEVIPENQLHISGTTSTSAGGLLRLDATTGDNFILFDNTNDSTEWAVGNDSSTRDEFRLYYNNGSAYTTQIVAIDGTHNNGKVTIDGGTDTLVNIRADSAGTAGLRLGGDSTQNQCTGFVEVHQDETHGGGFFYNGDGSPAFANTGEIADYFSLFRASGGQRHVVQRWVHNSNDCEMLGNVTIDNGTSTLVRVKGDSAGTAGVSIGGDSSQSQSTGYVEVHQDQTHGGGISYNGDANPAFATGETADHITFYRMNGGARSEVFSYPYNTDVVTFKDEIVYDNSHANHNSYNFMGGLFQAGTSGQNATNAPLLATTRHYGYGYQETFSTSNGAWTNPYPNLVLGYHTGVMIGGHPNYNGTRFFNDHPSATTSVVMNVGNGNNGVGVPHSLSKGGGTFRIRHPHPSKKYTHDLQHSFIEGPQCDNIYRGRVDLVDGSASINIDTVSNMTDGTFILLNRDIQCFTSNETGWTAVKGSVTENILTITAQDNSCTDTISWMVIGERQDDKIKSPDMDITDADGKLIVEPLTIESSHM